MNEVVDSRQTTLENLQIAWSHLDEVEERVEWFREQVIARINKGKELAAHAGLMANVAAGLASRFVVSRGKKDLLYKIEKAEKEIDVPPEMEAEEMLETKYGLLSAIDLRHQCLKLRGVVYALSGEAKNAIKHISQYLLENQDPDACYLLALAYEDTKEPRKAVDSYNKCVEQYENLKETYNQIKEDPEYEGFMERMGEICSEYLAACQMLAEDAKKTAYALEQKKMAGGWFVGSWKILITLLVLTLLGILGMTQKSTINVNDYIAAGFFGALTIGYWIIKRR